MLGYFPGYVESRIQLTAEPGLAFHRNSAKTGGLSDSCAEPKLVHRPPGPLAFLLLDDALQETQAAVHKGAHGRGQQRKRRLRYTPNCGGTLFVACSQIVFRWPDRHSSDARCGLGGIGCTAWAAGRDATIPRWNGQCRSPEGGVR